MNPLFVFIKYLEGSSPCRFSAEMLEQGRPSRSLRNRSAHCQGSCFLWGQPCISRHPPPTRCQWHGCSKSSRHSACPTESSHPPAHGKSVSHSQPWGQRCELGKAPGVAGHWSGRSEGPNRPHKCALSAKLAGKLVVSLCEFLLES